jgi:hypothetical protein
MYSRFILFKVETKKINQALYAHMNNKRKKKKVETKRLEIKI